MKFGNVFRLSMDSMLWRKKSTVALVVIITITLAILNIAATDYYQSIYKILRIKEIVEEPVDEACYIQNLYMPALDDMDYSTHMTQFMADVKELSEIEYCGRYYESSIFISTSAGNYYDGLELDTLIVDEELLALCGVEYQVYDDIEINSEALPLILGANVENKYSHGQLVYVDGVLYQIVGSLNEGSVWIASYLTTSDDADMSLDDMVIIFWDEDYIAPTGDFGGYLYGSNMYAVLKNSADFDAAYEKISDIAAEYNLVMKLETMSDQLAQIRQQNIADINEHLVIFIFIFLICIISTSSVSMVGILLQKKIYGTLTACGVATKDFVKMFIIKNGLLIVLSTAISVIYRIHSISSGGVNVELLMRIETTYTLRFIIGVAVVVLVLTSIMPIAYFTSLTPSEMIRNGEE